MIAIAVRIIEHQAERESSLVVFADPHRVGEFRQPVVQPFQYDCLKRTQISSHLFSLRIVPLAQFRNQLKEPCQPIRALKTGPSFSSEICSLLRDVLGGETLPQCFASRLNKRSVWKSPDQANEQPMPVDGRMPVVASVKRWRQFPGWCGVGIAIQGVANVVWILLVYASESEICKPLSRLDVKLTCVLGSSTHREEQEHGAEG